MARRRLEDERFAYFAEASIVFLDLPDAVFRGYEGDDELLGMPRADDDAPFELLRQEIARLEPQKVYFPLGVGGHVDHQLCREVGIRLLQEGRRWVMPGPEYAGIVTFYEDFPYAWWNDFKSLADLGFDPLGEPPGRREHPPEFADITDQLERKIMGINLYESQIERLFDGTLAMADAVRAYGPEIGELSAASTAPPSGTGPLAASDPMAPAPRRRNAGRGRTWSRWLVVFVAGILIRIVLLPTRGPRAATSTSSSCGSTASPSTASAHAYDQNLSFPPVDGVRLGRARRPRAGVQDRRRTRPTRGSATLMKTPASLADLGLAALLVYALPRDRPLLGGRSRAAIVLLHPAVIDVSAWWGQYETIYLLFGAGRGRVRR